MKDLMLAKKADKDLDSYSPARFAMEPKLDGMRVGISKRGPNVTIYSRTHKAQDGKLPHIEAALAAASDFDFDIDGEIVALARLVDTPQGPAPLGDFNRTMRVMGSDPAKAVRDQNLGGVLVLFVFDIMTLDDEDFSALPEGQRRTIVENFVESLDSPYIGVLPRFVPDVDTYAAYVAEGGEGMMLKDMKAGYIGKRRSAWLKVKVEMTEDVIVTGFKEGQGKYSDTVGAIVFSQYDANGNLVERGACSGMDDATRYDIGANRDAYLGRVMVVKHFGYASDAEVEGLRHPQFVAFRDDKAPEDCVIGQEG
jgi:ATP-dependent DNA ligase